jgi:hypothetical protein
MLSKNTIQYNNFRFKKKQSVNKQQSNKAVSLRSFPLFRWAVPVVRSSLRCTDHLPPKKRAALKKEQLFFWCRRSQSPHAHFLRSSGLLRPQHKPARKMRVSVCVHRPLFFQRLLSQPAITVGSAEALP